MPLDAQAYMLLEQIAMIEEFYDSSLSLEDIRRRSAASSVSTSPLEPVGHVENCTIAGPGGPLALRLYTPRGSGPFPILVYLHGGGWIIGNLDMIEPVCRNLANTAHCIVVSVNYRLAPEHKFPAALDDVFATIQWVAKNGRSFHGDPQRLAVGGDSAGGNLAAAVALKARDLGGPPLCYQILLYPSTDLTVYLDTTKRGIEYTLLSSERANFHTECYLNDWDDAKNPLASPLLAPSLTALPPALVVTTEYDLIYEQGRVYAERLQAEGVPVTYKHYNDMMHGFFSMINFLDKGKQALQEVGTILHHAFSQIEAEKRM